MPRTSPTTRKGHPPDNDPPTEQRDPTMRTSPHGEDHTGGGEHTH